MTSRLSAFLVAALATFMTANFAAAAGVTSFYVPEQTFAGDTTYATVRYEGDVSGFEWKMGTIDDRNVRQPPFSVQRTRMTTLTFKPTQAGRHWLSVIAVDNAGNEAGDELVREFSVEPVRLLGISLDVQGEIPQYSRVHFRPSSRRGMAQSPSAGKSGRLAATPGKI